MKRIQYKYLVALIYTCVLFIDRLDLTIVNITLPTLAKYFRVPIAQTDWVSTGFLLALAISIPISSWLGEKFGIKKIFIFSTAIFGIASLLCAFSNSIFMLSSFRFIQGIGGGMLIPTGMTMVYSSFEPHEYASVTSFTFLPSLLAPAIAPALGGAITHFWGWKWVFVFAFPICLFAVIISLLVLKEMDSLQKKPLDLKGFLFSSAALALLLYSISSLGKYGFVFGTNASIGLTIIFIYLFIKQEASVPHPLIDLKFFQHKLFVQSNLIQLAFQVCHFGSIFLIGMYLQVAVGMSAMVAGLVMGMQAFGAICTSRYSVKLFNDFGPTRPIVWGFIGIIIFTLAILCIQTPGQVFLGCAILFLRGIFSGLCGTPIQTTSIIDFNKADVGRASAIFNAGRQVSISLGIALSALLISYGFRVNQLTQVTILGRGLGYEGFHYAFMMIPVAAFLGIVFAMKINNAKVLEKVQRGKNG